MTTTQTTERDWGKRGRGEGQKEKGHRDERNAREVRRKKIAEERKGEGKSWGINRNKDKGQWGESKDSRRDRNERTERRELKPK